VTPFIGIGIYVRDLDGGVRLRAAVGYPWRNGLRLRRWLNPPEWAGQGGLYTDVIDGHEIIFTWVDASAHSLGCDTYIGPYAFTAWEDSGMNPSELHSLSDQEIRDIKTKFNNFAANWNVPPGPSALKMFLACAVDTAMHRMNIEQIPDDEWEFFYQRVCNPC
jgi:hypothetical protein